MIPYDYSSQILPSWHQKICWQFPLWLLSTCKNPLQRYGTITWKGDRPPLCPPNSGKCIEIVVLIVCVVIPMLFLVVVWKLINHIFINTWYATRSIIFHLVDVESTNHTLSVNCFIKKIIQSIETSLNKFQLISFGYYFPACEWKHSIDKAVILSGTRADSWCDPITHYLHFPIPYANIWHILRQRVLISIKRPKACICIHHVHHDFLNISYSKRGFLIEEVEFWIDSCTFFHYFY